jgi:hypothetical protein
LLNPCDARRYAGGIMLNVIMQNVIMLNVIMLNVIMQNVIMLSHCGERRNAECRGTASCTVGKGLLAL